MQKVNPVASDQVLICALTVSFLLTKGKVLGFFLMILISLTIMFFLVYDFKYTAFLSKSHTFQVFLFCLLFWILIINLAKNI